ncbi:TetR family transcriptional regulator [Lysinibacillus yapensis]|uniref:TetR family transcriptional regulator n=1 Tax=Ureibacillus yapensis TaxID=2304605 RepID=A0A396S400_9BACL|nr:TetR family transcriptional regulator [Lysinibacillus yapensis]
MVKVANYNQGTFYANFDSKAALLEEFIQDI